MACSLPTSLVRNDSATFLSHLPSKISAQLTYCRRLWCLWRSSELGPSGWFWRSVASHWAFGHCSSHDRCHQDDGFGITVATTYEQPYHLARRLSTIDHLSKGRWVQLSPRVNWAKPYMTKYWAEQSFSRLGWNVVFSISGFLVVLPPQH